MKNTLDYDVIIIGAGAAGLMCGVFAGRRGRRVLILENTSKIGEKIRISGGGRCNFTNIDASYKNYLSENPHFMKSALAQFDQHDFIKMVEAHGIAYHEKTLGQLFCDQSSKQIIDMLLDECDRGDVRVQASCRVRDIDYGNHFSVLTEHGTYTSESVVIASGGLSIPKIGATDFGYRMAKKFSMKIVPTRPALVPLTVTSSMQPIFSGLSGISNRSVVRYGKASFEENILFTHKGLSGPAILQISSYLKSFEGEKVQIDLLPEMDLVAALMQDKNLKQTVQNYLKSYLPNRFVETLAQHPKINQPLTDVRKEDLQTIAASLKNFNVVLAGSEGYAKAEVTAGGVDTTELSSKTMATKAIPNLFFIGEVVDVTGWLGGYNFQWAWSSGYVAGHHC